MTHKTNYPQSEMAEHLNIPKTSDREQIYQTIIPQIKSLTQHEPDTIANLANITAVLREALGFFWIGFYIVKEDELVLGPFQGTLACTRIRKGKGVCGTAWQQAQSQLVPDVELFPNHIACSSASRSEIVVPVIKNGEVVAVIDIDSDTIDDFTQTDVLYVEQIAQIVSTFNI